MTETTRKHIVDAAILLFNEDMSLPLERVAEKASVTRRTLHRYVTDRDELIKGCREEMMLSSKKPRDSALMSSTDPLDQLREMLYASIDCGVNFAFMEKLHTRRDHKHSQQKRDCIRYDEAVGRIKSVVALLQQQETVSSSVTVDWAVSLFFSMVATTCNHSHSAMAYSDIKRLAWYSYSKRLGI